MDIIEQVWKVANDVADNWDADLLYINSDIDEEALKYVIEETEARKYPEECIFVFLTTLRGRADWAYRIMRYLQSRYVEIDIFALGTCKGVGTLMCTGATSIWLGKSSELGSLDIGSETGANSAARNLATNVLRAAGQWLNKQHQGLRKTSDFDALELLLSGYPSNDFVIDKKGAQRLFNRVFDADLADSNGSLKRICEILEKHSRPKQVGVREDRDIFFLNGEYNWGD